MNKKILFLLGLLLFLPFVSQAITTDTHIVLRGSGLANVTAIQNNTGCYIYGYYFEAGGSNETHPVFSGDCSWWLPLPKALFCMNYGDCLHHWTGFKQNVPLSMWKVVYVETKNDAGVYPDKVCHGKTLSYCEGLPNFVNETTIDIFESLPVLTLPTGFVTNTLASASTLLTDFRTILIIVIAISAVFVLIEKIVSFFRDRKLK